jgi:signal transduction histidine kinase
MTRLLDYLPRGNTLDDSAWRRRHRFLQWVLLLHLPSLFLFGLALHHSLETTAAVLIAPAVCLLLGRVITQRRVASFFITAGLVYCSAALVGLSRGSIEAHFHFFVMIGFIALYQDWVPFLWNIVFTVLSHGLGSVWQTNLIFNHPAGQTSPWVWSGIHGAAVLAACVGVVVFWRTTELEQRKALDLTTRLADAEIGRRRFTSDLLVNLARRNQSMLYRQLDIINQLEEQEHDPDALAELFRLDHLATRIRRNAESLLVLSGEEAPRAWGEPVLLLDVVRAAIAETEDLDRVIFSIDERLAVNGRVVTDLTHLLAELMENAVRFSPPEASVTVRTRPYLQQPGAHVLTVEDWGVGMPPEEFAVANDLLAHPREVDLSVSQRLGLHVVARLAQRHDIEVSLTPTPGCGVTAVVALPPELFAEAQAATAADRGAAPPVPAVAPAPPAEAAAPPEPLRVAAAPAVPAAPAARPAAANGSRPLDGGRAWPGWWDAVLPPEPEREAAEPTAAMAGPAPAPAAPPPEPDGDGDVPPGEPRLTRRVPQAHLAPELRRGTPAGAGAPPAPAPDPAQAREALTRYQVSRQAARALVEDDEDNGAGDGDGDRQAGAGGW